jgi:hypothetical protein
MTANADEEKELVLAGGPKDRHWRGRLQGLTLTQATWAEGGRPRETVKTFPNLAQARDQLWKAVRAKLRAGYVFRRDLAAAGPGEVVLETFAPGLLDISPDGRALVTATHGKGGRGCKIILVDVGSGARRVAFEEPAGSRQTFLHAALFDHTCATLYLQVNEDTWRLDLRSGAREKVAGYVEWRTANFNPFVVRPSFDTARRRLVVFDADSVVRVLGLGVRHCWRYRPPRRPPSAGRGRSRRPASCWPCTGSAAASCTPTPTPCTTGPTRWRSGTLRADNYRCGCPSLTSSAGWESTPGTST